MAAKRAAFFTLALITAFISSGCWDALDINRKSLCTLVITDREGDNFVFYAEVPNLALGQQQETSGAAHYDVVSGAGRTYADARRAINNQMDKPLFLGTVRALMLTDSLAKYGIEEYFYRLQTMVDYRRVLEVVTTHSKPEEIFSVSLESNVSLGYEIDDTITTLKDSGKLVIYTVSDALNFLYADRSFVVANMDAVNGRLAFTGYTIMRGSHYAGFIPVDEAGGVIWLLGRNIAHIRAVPTDSYIATVEIKCKSRKITPQYLNGQVTFNIDMDYTAQLMYMDNNIAVDKEQVEVINSEMQALLLDEIVQAIQHSQAIGCDYLEL
ncbi:MAG: Ger(x)C family spore germination C-terminal domain-containing protein [Christensenellales bacterium]|jgi:spore germination protein KC